MRLLTRSTRRHVLRGVGWSAAAFGAAQLAAVAVIVGVDELRKHRADLPPTFPSAPPRDNEIAGSSVTTYTKGADVFDDMLEAIRGATETVYFETYIWKGDEVGKAFRDALIEAAERGVQVFVVFDGFANLLVPPRFYRFPASVNVLRFPTLRWGVLRLDLRRFGRDHRKLLVVDERIGFVGGYNIGELYSSSWRDTHLRVVGPAVWELEDAFVDFWNEYRPRGAPPLEERGAKDWEPRIQAARNAPSRMLFPVRGLYLDAIDRAAERIYLTQAYFLPDAEILDGLLKASRRGVDVRVILPEYSNHVIADWAARRYYDQLLAGGVTIWLYENAMVHAKTATVDGRWSTVGTANIDRLSMIGNYEVNLALFSDAMAQTMEDVFAMDLSNCRQLVLEEWQGRSRVTRLAEWLVEPLRWML